MTTEHVNQIEHTLTSGMIFLIRLFLIIPILLLSLLPYLFVWDYETFKLGREVFSNHLWTITLFAIVTYELMRGVISILIASNGIKSIKFKVFGKHIIYCKERLFVKQFRIYMLIPIIILGILPISIGFILGSGLMLIIGIYITWYAGSEIIILFMLKKLKNNTYVLEHPKKLGFYELIDADTA